MCDASPLRSGAEAAISQRDLGESPTVGELKALSQFVPEMHCIADGDGYFKRVNAAFEATLGYSAGELLTRPFVEFVHPDDHQPTQDAFRKLIIGVPLVRFENRCRCQDGSYRWLSWQATAEDRSGRIYAVASDVTQRKEAERRDEFTKALQEMFSKKGSRKEYCDSIVEIIRDWIGCRCVGIRVVDTEAQIPYESHTGFSPEFLTRANWLSLKHDECACTRVIVGRPEPQDAAAMTPGGSFLREQAIEFVEASPLEERCRSLGTCMRAGFASLAIIPIRYRQETVAAIHIADEREGMVPLATIEFIESMTPLVGEAVHWFNMEEEIEAQRRVQTVLSRILHISLETATLEELLQRTLDLLLSLPWLSLQSKGSVFLVEEDSTTLVMKAQRGLTEQVQGSCGRVPFGKCLCGRAAATQQIVFADRVDARHEICYPGMPPHGHYCVPILSGDRAIGAMCLYVDEGHRRKPAEETFLLSVADVLAGTIHRKQSEHRVKENEAQLLAAQRIQEHLLPKEPPRLAGFDIAGASHPAEFACGDTFDYLAMYDGSLGVAIGDVMEHGFAPALLMASTRAYLRLLAQTSSDVGEILTRANRILVEEMEDDRFITFFLGRLDAQSRSFTYCSAGHPTGYLLSASGNVKTRLESGGLPLGISADARFAALGPLPLEPGDLLLLVTDGIRESQSPQGGQFGDGRILETVGGLRSQPARSIIEGLHRAVLDFCRREKPVDDVTVVVLKVDGEEKCR